MKMLCTNLKHLSTTVVIYFGGCVRVKSTEHVTLMNILIFRTAITTPWSVFFTNQWQYVFTIFSDKSLNEECHRIAFLATRTGSGINDLHCFHFCFVLLGSAEHDPGFT